MKRFFISLALSLIIFTSLSFAQSPMTDAKFNAAMPAPVMIPPPPALERSKAYVLMDANSGQVLAQKNMNERLDPASLTKMMTLYIAFNALRSGQIHLDDQVLISEKAWRMDGSRMFVRVGSEVPVSELLQGIIVASGNDACVALAEHIAGNEETFAELMNQTAQKLGMKDTHYNDSTGMPDPNHYATAYNLALLARALVQDFPEYYSYFKQQWYTYNKIKQPNRNLLLWRDKSVDGIKTGHTEEAGFCLVSSAKRHGMRLISVLMGDTSESNRANDSEALLTYGFRFFETHLVFKANTPITTARVWYGRDKTLALGVASDFYVTTHAKQFKELKGVLNVDKHIKAPIKKGQAAGSINAMINGQNLTSAPLVALEDDPEGGFISMSVDKLMGLFK